VWHT